jgi:hypothetical protein
VNLEGKPIKYEHLVTEPASQAAIVRALEPHVSAIETRYGATVRGIELPVFQQYHENPNDPCELHGCENSRYARKRWVKVKDVDLVGFLWLKDFNGGVPLDPRFEVYGGKLEFAAFNFSLVPQRGTLVLFPADPHFITAISPILVGSLEQVKVTVKLSVDGGPFFYQPADFPGTFQEWFLEHESN